jgi:hypothetical protein
MKIAMTLLVKNEMDVIETHIRYHRPKVDFMVVMDNMSGDGTYETLLSLSEELGGIVVLTMASRVYDQAFWVTRMVRHCAEMGADWVVNSDADEFWVGDLRYVVEEFWKVGANIVYPCGTTFVPTVRDDPMVLNPIKRMLHRDPDSVEFGSKKAIHATEGFSHVEQGNHYARFVPCITDHVQETTSLKLCHYPMRGEEQFVSKHRGAWSETKLKQMGIGWRGINNVCVEGGEESLRKFYREQVCYSEERMAKRGLALDETMKLELSG